MGDIGIYTTMRVLQHKQTDGRKSEGEEAYWRFSRLRHFNVKAGDRLWFACEKEWKGYFIIDRLDRVPEIDGDLVEVVFHSETWHADEFTMPRMPFQGFTYSVPVRERRLE